MNEPWLFLGQSRPGFPDSRAQLKEIPPGPYVHIAQSDVDKFEKDYYTRTDLKIENEFYLRFGHVTYAVGPDFKPIRVGYWLDCSD